jgi:hypothetical protein
MKKKGFSCRVEYDSLIFFEWKPKDRPQDHIPFILKNLFIRIEDEAKKNNDYIFYEVPSILPEFPWYDVIKTAEIVSKKIANKGFIVKLYENVIFVCWNKKELEKNSKIKINIETKEKKREKAMQKMDLINQNRYGYFINPKRNKKSNVDFDEPEEEQEKQLSQQDFSRIIDIYR